MAPGLASRKPRENQFPFDLGIKGRKTGVTVPDTGVRDEHGLEPLEGLFSSPTKPEIIKKSTRNGSRKAANMNVTLSSEEDMEMGESTVPEPTEVLNKRASMRLPPPRSKSPIKTFLQSPARRHPSLGPISSPTRGSIVSPSRASVHTSVNRRLDFSKNDLNRTVESTASNASPQKLNRPTSKLMSVAKLTNGARLSPNPQKPGFPSNSDVEQEQEESEMPVGESALEDGGDSYQLVQADDEDIDQQEEPEVERTPIKRKRRTHSFPQNPTATAVAIKRGKGRPPRTSIETPIPIEEDNAEVEEERPAKKSRGMPKKSDSTGDGPRKRAPVAQKLKSSRPSISSPPEVHRGPPRPKNSRGLYILRREAPDGISNTRSGRNVIKPLAWWKNETVVYGEDEEIDGKGKFLVPVIKEVVRAEEVEEFTTRRPRKGGKSTKRKQIVEEEETEDEDLAEPWESEPGRIFGDVRVWDPEDQSGQGTEEKEEEIALSGEALQTREIPRATFRFAKTLTLPFFGSGCVDLPPGGLKKPKNSRRMHMCFFVFSGRVSVTVNENTFRIGKGGLWQVPRGNFYSIENDYDKPARIFFSQGCDLTEVDSS